MTRWPFHAGELEAQRLAGGGNQGAGIRPFMPDQHRVFFEALPFVVLGASDQGWPVASLLAGRPGFVSSPDATHLRIRAALGAGDPVARALAPGAPLGLLGIDLATRRRNRANGVVETRDRTGLVLAVRQSFGNCPQYIQPRELRVETTVQEGPSEPGEALDPAAGALIAQADTFFIASAARTEEETGGIDVSHRGGPPGFVRGDGGVLTIPDFKGNRYFNTLGNLVSQPRAALLFVDFARGDLLHVQGTTEIVWGGAEVAEYPGAERLWRVRVERVLRRPGAVGLRWTARSL